MALSEEEMQKALALGVKLHKQAGEHLEQAAEAWAKGTEIGEVTAASLRALATDIHAAVGFLAKAMEDEWGKPD